MPRILVFDVNETLLDLGALDPLFEALFGRSGVRAAWFGQVLQTALVATATGEYADFSAVGAAALEMTAARLGVHLPPDARAQVAAGVSTLPPHPEVPAALRRLRDAGLRMVALTNSTATVAPAQLRNAGLIDCFERVFSVDAVRRFKPAPEPYRYVAGQLGVPPAGLRMVAAHDWDVTGAVRAGYAGAFVARPGMVLGPLSEHPDIVGPDLAAVAGRIIEVEGGG